MTNEQAIEVLNGHIKDSSVAYGTFTGQALRMAIEALKAQLSKEGTTFALNNQVNLCDSCTYTYPECPSEKDDVLFGNGIGNDNICACNKYQPTVQPVATDTNVGDTISRQAAIDAIDEERKQRHLFNTVEDGLLEARRIINTLPSAQPDLQPTCNQLATDCIDRQAAIDAVRKSLVKEVTPAFMLIDKTEVMTELMMLPSARPKRKTREWIKVPRCEGDTQPDLKCPICGNVIGWWDLGRYCAGCGTKLEGGAG